MPLTVAVNVAESVAVPGETVTLVTVAVALVAAIVTVAVPDLLVSTRLVAVTVIVCTDDVAAGAVNTPELEIVPAVAVHETPCDGELVPATTAEKVVDPVAVVGDTVTLVTVGALGSVSPGASGLPSMPTTATAEVPGCGKLVPAAFVKRAMLAS